MGETVHNEGSKNDSKNNKKVQMTLKIAKMVDISLVSLLRDSSVILVTRLKN